MTFNQETVLDPVAQQRLDVAQLLLAAEAFATLASWIDDRSSRAASIRELQVRLDSIAIAAGIGVDSSVLRDLTEATGTAVAIACQGDDVRVDRRTVDESCDMLEMFVLHTRSAVICPGVQPEDWLSSVGQRARTVTQSLPGEAGDAAVELIGCLATAIVLSED